MGRRAELKGSVLLPSTAAWVDNEEGSWAGPSGGTCACGPSLYEAEGVAQGDQAPHQAKSEEQPGGAAMAADAQAGVAARPQGDQAKDAEENDLQGATKGCLIGEAGKHHILMYVGVLNRKSMRPDQCVLLRSTRAHEQGTCKQA